MAEASTDKQVFMTRAQARVAVENISERLVKFNKAVNGIIRDDGSKAQLAMIEFLVTQWVEGEELAPGCVGDKSRQECQDIVLTLEKNVQDWEAKHGKALPDDLRSEMHAMHGEFYNVVVGRGYTTASGGGGK